jgi:hypothetical protein
MSGFGKIYESSNWGVGVCDNTIGWGSSYKSIANCTDASFSYSADSFAQNGSNPTPTITGDAGGTFTATPSGLSLNASTGEITLSTSTINSYTIRYTLPDTTFAEQTVGITAAPFASTRSFEFDGVNDRFFIGSGTGTNIDLGTECTISFWMNGATSYNGFIFGESGSTLGVLWSTTTVFYFYVNGAFAPNFSNVPPLLTANSWHHVAIVRNGTSVSVYVNGSFVETKTGSPFTASTKIAQIGARTSGSSINSAWEGKLDEIAFWNSALTSTAVTEIYNSGVPNDLDELTNASDPTAWYRMGE